MPYTAEAIIEPSRVKYSSQENKERKSVVPQVVQEAKGLERFLRRLLSDSEDRSQIQPEIPPIPQLFDHELHQAVEARIDHIEDFLNFMLGHAGQIREKLGSKRWQNRFEKNIAPQLVKMQAELYTVLFPLHQVSWAMSRKLRNLESPWLHRSEMAQKYLRAVVSLSILLSLIGGGVHAATNADKLVNQANKVGLNLENLDQLAAALSLNARTAHAYEDEGVDGEIGGGGYSHEAETNAGVDFNQLLTEFNTVIDEAGQLVEMAAEQLGLTPDNPASPFVFKITQVNNAAQLYLMSDGGLEADSYPEDLVATDFWKVIVTDPQKLMGIDGMTLQAWTTTDGQALPIPSLIAEDGRVFFAVAQNQSSSVLRFIPVESVDGIDIPGFEDFSKESEIGFDSADARAGLRPIDPAEEAVESENAFEAGLVLEMTESHALKIGPTSDTGANGRARQGKLVVSLGREELDENNQTWIQVARQDNGRVGWVPFELVRNTGEVVDAADYLSAASETSGETGGGEDPTDNNTISVGEDEGREDQEQIVPVEGDTMVTKGDTEYKNFPSAQEAIMGTFPQGTPVAVIDPNQIDGMVRVEDLATGTRGWVPVESMEFVPEGLDPETLLNASNPDVDAGSILVLADGTPYYATYGTSDQALGRIRSGTPIRVLDNTVEGWLLVYRLDTGEEGWISTQDLEYQVYTDSLYTAEALRLTEAEIAYFDQLMDQETEIALHVFMEVDDQGRIFFTNSEGNPVTLPLTTGSDLQYRVALLAGQVVQHTGKQRLEFILNRESDGSIIGTPVLRVINPFPIGQNENMENNALITVEEDGVTHYINTDESTHRTIVIRLTPDKIALLQEFPELKNVFFDEGGFILVETVLRDGQEQIATVITADRAIHLSASVLEVSSQNPQVQVTREPFENAFVVGTVGPEAVATPITMEELELLPELLPEGLELTDLQYDPETGFLSYQGHYLARVTYQQAQFLGFINSRDFEKRSNGGQTNIEPLVKPVAAPEPPADRLASSEALAALPAELEGRTELVRVVGEQTFAYHPFDLQLAGGNHLEAAAYFEWKVNEETGVLEWVNLMEGRAEYESRFPDVFYTSALENVQQGERVWFDTQEGMYARVMEVDNGFIETAYWRPGMAANPDSAAAYDYGWATKDSTSRDGEIVFFWGVKGREEHWTNQDDSVINNFGFSQRFLEEDAIRNGSLYPSLLSALRQELPQELRNHEIVIHFTHDTGTTRQGFNNGFMRGNLINGRAVGTEVTDSQIIIRISVQEYILPFAPDGKRGLPLGMTLTTLFFRWAAPEIHLHQTYPETDYDIRNTPYSPQGATDTIEARTNYYLQIFEGKSE